ncbi:hypothetical protein G4Y79_09490 [Phototrophicus methaneseepsis]|uniref:SH3b domain-containing protein n=1 Tax=Phototrophicus methaneseepsis TaxID=2710758 RepID=A0A7S8ED12_9CHLR|nr:hypothetical protein [Phototrophicus methaneseepsis]QPC84589.1 hypothetical protein G4Y79_09490 [Phototrophicus methaneseepsis]
MKRWGYILLILLIMGHAAAQDAAACSADVLLALARASSACYSMARNEACAGSGSVVFTVVDDGTDSNIEAQPGTTVLLNELSQVGVFPGAGDISLVRLQVQASIPDNEGASLTLLAVGDALLQNDVAPMASFFVTARGTVKVRAVPQVNGSILTEMPVNRALVANGRTDDTQWIRVLIPNSNDLGWVSADVITSSEPLAALSVVNASTSYRRPFQDFQFSHNDVRYCDGSLPGGLLIQSPQPDHAVEVTLNGIALQVAATVFVHNAGDALAFDVLEGHLVVGEPSVGQSEVFVPAGARVHVADGQVTGPVPFGSFEDAGLPLNMLPRRMTVVSNITEADIDAARQTWLEETQPSLMNRPASTPDTTCRHVVSMNTQLYAGPGDFYEVVNPVSQGTRIHPVQQTTDANDVVWYQLRQSSWIRASRVEAQGICNPVPIVNREPAPATNTVSLETCEPTNGPVRAGQMVTFQFMPPPWDNYGEARDAVIIDPGEIVLNEQTYLTVCATEPRRLGTEDDRYLRIFQAVWQAEPGTYRVRGERLSYIAICSITVPVE